jgi:hypothetical protein
MCLRQQSQIVARRLRFGGAVLEHQMRNQHGTDERYWWAGVKLVVQAVAERVLFELGNDQARVHEGDWLLVIGY